VILFYSLPVELGAYQYRYNVYVTLFYKSYKFRIKLKKKKKKIRFLRIKKNSLAYLLVNLE